MLGAAVGEQGQGGEAEGGGEEVQGGGSALAYPARVPAGPAHQEGLRAQQQTRERPLYSRLILQSIPR